MSFALCNNISSLLLQFGRSPFLMIYKQWVHLQRNITRVNFFRENFSKFLEINEVTVVKDYNQWLGQFLPDTKIIIQPKICGLPIILVYKNGDLEGSIKTNNKELEKRILSRVNLPKEIPINKDIYISGVLYLKGYSFLEAKLISKECGWNRIYLKSELKLCCFDILNSRLNQNNTLKELKSLGFEIPSFEIIGTTCQVDIFRRLWQESKIFNQYPTEGLLLKLNSRKLQRLLSLNDSKVQDYFIIKS